ncbi:MAG: hypothetical protein A2176_05345 [Spirochaetes bacterium RBG_13_51_14]|nr:MAG: hypothetical protein A2176_05345 [Spirochaetes bacterium RBG_13_51_14]
MFVTGMLLVLLVSLSGGAAAGTFDTGSYTRTQSRAAAVGVIDAAYYNPVGLAALSEGFYLDAGYQVMTKTTAYDMAFSGGEDATPSPFIPNFAAVYKQGKGALFLSLHMPEGVELIEYRKPEGGMPLVSYFALNLDPVQMSTLRNAGLTLNLGPLELPVVTYVKAGRYWLQGRLGGAFALNDMIALTGGIACSYYEGDRSAGILDAGTVDKLEKNAVGWSGLFGLMLGKADRAVLTALYSTQVIARGTEKNVKYSYTRVMEERLPDYLLIGVNFKTEDKASIQLSYQIAFSGERNYGTRNLLTRNHEIGFLDWILVAQNASSWAVLPLIAGGNAQNYKHKDRHSIGLGIELQVAGMLISSGISYTSQEKYPRAQNPLDPDLARVGVGAGAKFQASDIITIDTGSAYYFYVTDRMLFHSIKMNKTAWSWGISVTIKAI